MGAAPPPPPTGRPPFQPKPRTRDTVIAVIGCIVAGIGAAFWVLLFLS